jgi:hypothetical protein
VTSPAEHAATVRVNLHVHETPCDPGTCHGTCHVCRSGEALDALVALAARADELERERDEWKREAELSKWPKEAAQEYHRMKVALPAAEQRAERAEAALRQIADGAESNPAHEVAALARAALGEQP